MTLYTLTCEETGETQTVCVCDSCADFMPPVDGDHVRAERADDDCACECCKGAR